MAIRMDAGTILTSLVTLTLVASTSCGMRFTALASACTVVGGREAERPPRGDPRAGQRAHAAALDSLNPRARGGTGAPEPLSGFVRRRAHRRHALPTPRRASPHATLFTLGYEWLFNRPERVAALRVRVGESAR